ncbi:MAG: phenylalanine--tRNA ligase subunit alpha [Candidatus Dadabacteria bacterium]|nr:MAG: phenylalanine--tRNA ligase subunit alpha [Candidatus Dadabacteria bacterium]
MIERLQALADRALAEIRAAADSQALEELRVRYLGRKGEVTACLKDMGRLDPAERPVVGRVANEVKAAIETALAERREALGAAELERRLRAEAVDVTLPGRRGHRGGLHPLTRVVRELLEIFGQMGFSVAEGPEVELEYYNFEALNIPADHPARDMQDTFFVAPGVVLRTHTSPVQIRTMEARKPPVKIVAPGKVYRCDSDVTHSPMFHQIEGLLVDRDVTFADLKGVLTEFVHRYYGPDTGVRFRPSFFPFTEPSAEVDIQCVLCGGAGCRVCSGTGWLEILGSGMVDPAVYGFVGYDPEEVQGFAFGLGVERIAMLKYGIDDIRLFFENDLRFLGHFG